MAQKTFFKGVLAAALTLGVLFVSCENEQLTTDDVKSAVREEIAGTQQRESLDSEFLRGLKNGSYTVSQSGSNYTVMNDFDTSISLSIADDNRSSGGSGNPTVYKSIYVRDSSSASVVYDVELKVKSTGYTLTGSTYKITGATTETEKKIVFGYQVFEAGINKRLVTSGDITVSAKPTEAGIASALARTFESSLFNTSGIEDIWTDVAATAFGQVPDAKYTCTIVKPDASLTINLPSSVAGTITWGTASSPLPTGVTYTNGATTINIANTLVAGTVTIPFKLTHGLTGSKEIKGTLVITTKASR
jgi:hypothetical protein